MRMQYFGLMAGLIMSTTLAGCGGVQNLNGSALLDAGGSLYKSASLSDEDVVQIANESCAPSDRQTRLAPLGSA